MRNILLLYTILLPLLYSCSPQNEKTKKPLPNFVIIYSDDQRYDAIGCEYEGKALTPNLDALCKSGIYFEQACVTLSICSPSRAALLTGRYGMANGVTTYGKVHLNEGEQTFAQLLQKQGYQTGIVGKWHLADSPQSLGFEYATHFFSNGSWYDRKVIENGVENIAAGFIEDYNAEKAIDFLEQTQQKEQPYLLFYCPQLPHLDNKFNWDVTEETLATYIDRNIELPKNWTDQDLIGKPTYLKTGRHRAKAISYGYRDKDTLKYQTKRYYAAITEMDAAMGRMLQKARELDKQNNTYFIFMSDNGWFIGDHLFTSKVLAYEASMRVPLVVAGPNIAPATSKDLVLNIDLFPTLLELSGQKVPANLHGKSLLSILEGKSWTHPREQVFYQAPTPQLGSQPHFAIRTLDWKYIETQLPDSTTFVELYQLSSDPNELNNLADDPTYRIQQEEFADLLQQQRPRYLGMSTE